MTKGSFDGVVASQPSEKSWPQVWYNRPGPPVPWGNQGRHFNRSGVSGNVFADSRIISRNEELEEAKRNCSEGGKGAQSAKHLGRALHAIQDYWAHGAYGEAMGLGVWRAHSPIYDEWAPGFFDPRTHDGRAAVWFEEALGLDGLQVETSLPDNRWQIGTARNNGTFVDTMLIIDEFLRYVREEDNDACPCKKYFLKD